MFLLFRVGDLALVRYITPYALVLSFISKSISKITAGLARLFTSVAHLAFLFTSLLAFCVPLALISLQHDVVHSLSILARRCLLIFLTHIVVNDTSLNLVHYISLDFRLVLILTVWMTASLIFSYWLSTQVSLLPPPWMS